MDPAYQSFIDGIRIPDLGGEAPLEYALRTLVRPETGDVAVEVGVFQGHSITKIGVRYAGSTARVVGFDSFEGLPERWDRPDKSFELGHFDVRGELPAVPPNIELVRGWFADTLPPFAAELGAQGRLIGLLHVDCDLYSSTKCTLDALAPHLRRDGVVVVFDELFGYPNHEAHELRALYELVRDGGWEVEWLGKRGPLHGALPGGEFEAAVVRLTEYQPKSASLDS